MDWCLEWWLVKPSDARHSALGDHLDELQDLEDNNDNQLWLAELKLDHFSQLVWQACKRKEWKSLDLSKLVQRQFDSSVRQVQLDLPPRRLQVETIRRHPWA